MIKLSVSIFIQTTGYIISTVRKSQSVYQKFSIQYLALKNQNYSLCIKCTIHCVLIKGNVLMQGWEKGIVIAHH